MTQELLAVRMTDFTDEEKIKHYQNVCESLGLNASLRPFEYFMADDQYEGRKLVMYVTKAGGNQLRKVHHISIDPVIVKIEGGVATVVATAKDSTGRTDSCVGSVTVEGKKGKALEDAVMWAETKAKRRVTISITGIGMLDESEVQEMGAGTITKVEATAQTVSNVATPVVATAGPAQEVTSASTSSLNLDGVALGSPDRKPTTEELNSFRERFNMYCNRTLPEAGLLAATGTRSTNMVKKWFLDKAKVSASRDLTYLQWFDTLAFMDQAVAAGETKRLVETVTEFNK